MPSLNKVFGDLPVTIFEAMSQLARDNNAINLGQGFPDDPGPEDIRRAAADAGEQFIFFFSEHNSRSLDSAHFKTDANFKLHPFAYLSPLPKD